MTQCNGMSTTMDVRRLDSTSTQLQQFRQIISVTLSLFTGKQDYRWYSQEPTYICMTYNFFLLYDGVKVMCSVETIIRILNFDLFLG